jgi:hypothetical protein
MRIVTDTGTVIVRCGPGRPLGSNRDHLDTGPMQDLHRRWAEEPHLKFETVARAVADRIHNSAYVQPLSRVKRLRRAYPRWLEQKNRQAEFLSRD